MGRRSGFIAGKTRSSRSEHKKNAPISRRAFEKEWPAALLRPGTRKPDQLFASPSGFVSAAGAASVAGASAAASDFGAFAALAFPPVFFVADLRPPFDFL